MIGIALSLVPLIVVMEVSTGMIDGITARLLEIGTYHLQVPMLPGSSEDSLVEASRRIATDLGKKVIPANDIAREVVGSQQLASMVALGAYVARTGVVAMKTVIDCIPKVVSRK